MNIKFMNSAEAKNIIENSKKLKLEQELASLYGPRIFKTVDLPKNQWYECTVCNGEGQYEDSGDLHRSPGIVPCGRCGQTGIMRTKTIEIKRRIRVKAKTRKCHGTD